MTDIVWLHAFRILPSRMMRQQMFCGQAGVIWAGNEDHVLNWIQMFADVCDKYKFEHALGFISPLDHGKFAFIEYDFYFDHNDPDAGSRVSKALIETTERSLVMDGILTIFNYIFKGLYRKEHLLYPIPKGISKEEQGLFKELLTSIIGE